MDYVKYSPSIIDRESNSVKPQKPYIKGCFSSGGSFIIAKELTKYVKVFTEWDRGNYISGVPGDYLAARLNDLTDLPFITRTRPDVPDACRR